MTQSQALDILKMGHNVFLTGAPGTGKTYVLNQYIDYLESHDIPVAVTASTGIAATHIGGMTIHSWSGIGIRERLSEWDIEAMLEKKYLWDRFQTTKVLIIDEVSMLASGMLDSLDMLARSMRNNPAPFGGMQVVLVGDFFQLPPVGNDSVSYSFFASAWREAQMHICYLEKSYRQDDGPLLTVLSHIRTCQVSTETRNVLAQCTDIQITHVEPTKLYTHNADVDAINDEKLAELEEDEEVFVMRTKGQKKYVETLTKSVLAPEILKLKVGASVMFVKNNPELGYMNGTLGRVTSLDDDVIVETAEGNKIVVEAETWSMTNDDGRVLAEAVQLPLRLAWAITVHKSQGMTLDAAEIDLSKCFVPGQGYVALSRVRTIQGLKVVGYNDQALAVDATVSNRDRAFRQESEQLVRRLLVTEEKKIAKLHKDFILYCGGTLEPKLNKKDTKGKKKIHTKISTYDETKKLVLEQMSIEDIVEKRELTKNTILDHIQKLRDDGELSVDDIAHIRPNRNSFDADITRVAAAMKKVKDDKLATLRHALDEYYSYDDLRVIKLFVE